MWYGSVHVVDVNLFFKSHLVSWPQPTAVQSLAPTQRENLWFETKKFGKQKNEERKKMPKPRLH